jgi:hypothetical protein
MEPLLAPPATRAPLLATPAGVGPAPTETWERAPQVEAELVEAPAPAVDLTPVDVEAAQVPAALVPAGPLVAEPVRPGWRTSAARRQLLYAIGRGIESVWDWCFGVFSLIVGLAFLSAIPVLNLLSLGYLLEVSGRIARTGKFTAGFVGMRKASRVGSAVFGAFLVLLPLRFTLSMATQGRIIDPTSSATEGWAFAHFLLSIVLGIHVLIACARGGKLRHFLWPFPHPLRPVFWLGGKLLAVAAWPLRKLGVLPQPVQVEVVDALPRPESRLRRWLRAPVAETARGYTLARDAVWDFVVSLRLPYYFWLGARGFVGTVVWLAIPVTCLALGHRAPLLGFLGAALLAFVVLHLPFLQARFAAHNRLSAIFELRAVRRQFQRAPIAWWTAVATTLLFALPLYLAKIEMVPAEIGSVLSLLFVVFIFPARLLTGWAYARSLRREQPRHWVFRWMSSLAMVPVAGFYVLVIFFTQYLAWYGKLSLIEQHAFLVPAPFLNM